MKYLFLLTILLLMACGEEPVLEKEIEDVVEKEEVVIAAKVSSPTIPSPPVVQPFVSPPSAKEYPKSVSLDINKTNRVLYVGVENMVKVNLIGYDRQELNVSVSNGSVKRFRKGMNYYIVKPDRSGQVVMSISTLMDGEISRIPLYVKRIPNPVLKMAARSSGDMLVSKFIGATGVYAELENFDLEVKCSVVDFELLRIKEDGTKWRVPNNGGVFQEKALTMVKEAEPGEIYIVDHAKIRCPGDDRSRTTNALVFYIR